MKRDTVMHSHDNSCGTASVILGILSLVSASPIAILLGIIGLIFGVKQKRKQQNRWSTWGITLNIIGIIIGIIMIIVAVRIIASDPSLLQSISG